MRRVVTDPRFRPLLRALLGCPGPVSVTELAQRTYSGRTTVARHLNVLEAWGVVRRISEGQGAGRGHKNIYQIVAPTEVEIWLIQS
jgi:predicted ArsR family transcriptional regulator